MWTLKRFGLFIGYSNFILYSLGLISVAIILVKEGKINTAEYLDYTLDILVETGHNFPIFRLIMYLLMTITSGILLNGIIKRRHKLMIPWLLGTFIVILVNIVPVAFALLARKVPIAGFTSYMIDVGIQSLMFYTIYKLRNDIRDETKISKGKA